MTEKKYTKKGAILMRDDLYDWVKKKAKENGFVVWKQIEVILEYYKERHEK